MRKGVERQTAQIERLKELGEQQILSSLEIQQYIMAITADFKLEDMT